MPDAPAQAGDPKSTLRCAWGLLLSLSCSACANLTYYGQLAQGEYELLSRRESIREIVQDDSRDAALRQRLQNVLEARAFATAQLGLPDNGSYTQYSDLQRPYVLWNVFATPELSLAPVQHCFLFAGCVAYRGYFKKSGAEERAARLRQAGYETYVAGVPAFSTLGWFDDPVINSMMRWDDATLIGSVFHELAHQKFYLKDDSAFNESFASFVEREGLRQYRAAGHALAGDPPLQRQRQHQFVELALETRARLTALYATSLPPAAMREHKRQEFENLERAYRRLRDGEWQGYAGYDRWFEDGLNNAQLLPFGLYDQWVPAFAALYARKPGDWAAFYDAVQRLAHESEAQRLHGLQRLAAEAASE